MEKRLELTRTAQNRSPTRAAAAHAGNAFGHVPAEPPKRRLSAADRRREILPNPSNISPPSDLDGGTRELARHLGTTQPLLTATSQTRRADPGIYKVVYLDQWNPGWDALFTDRKSAAPERLQSFYEEYTDLIFNPQWMRIYFFAGLKGVSINERYLALVGGPASCGGLLREFRDRVWPRSVAGPRTRGPGDRLASARRHLFIMVCAANVYRTPFQLLEMRDDQPVAGHVFCRL